MAFFEINWQPDTRKLRQFGLIGLIALPLAGWLWAGPASPITFGVLACIGALLGLLAALWPRGLWPVYMALSLLTAPIGLVVSEVVLVVIFVGVFLPMALLFRLIGRDALLRRIDVKAATYWLPKSQPRGVESYFRQS